MVEVMERPKERTRSERTDNMAHSIRKIGIVGAGQMGSGIAHVCALSGFHVLLNDVVADRITQGLATISGNLARQVSRQRISDEQRQAAIKLIAPAKSLEDLGNCQPRSPDRSLVEHHVIAGEGTYMSNAVTHLAGADDADLANRMGHALIPLAAGMGPLLGPFFDLDHVNSP